MTTVAAIVLVAIVRWPRTVPSDGLIEPLCDGSAHPQIGRPFLHWGTLRCVVFVAQGVAGMVRDHGETSLVWKLVHVMHVKLRHAAEFNN